MELFDFEDVVQVAWDEALSEGRQLRGILHPWAYRGGARELSPMDRAVAWKSEYPAFKHRAGFVLIFKDEDKTVITVSRHSYSLYFTEGFRSLEEEAPIGGVLTISAVPVCLASSVHKALGIENFTSQVFFNATGGSFACALEGSKSV